VKKYGVGKWQKILNDPTLAKGFRENRTGVQLKDKWRGLAKARGATR
jgi:hypothetical protein